MTAEHRSNGPRRWPDLMIGVLVLALLGGFGALLAGQRKKPEVATVPTPPPASQAVIPDSPGTVPEVVEPTPAPPATVKPTVTTPSTPAATAPQNTTPTPAPADTSKTPTTPPTTATPTQETTTPATEIPPVPEAPKVDPIKPPTPAPKSEPATPAEAKPATAQETKPAETATAPTATPRTGGAVATSENRVPLRSDFRISLGSFSSAATVQTQTAGVSALGYTVHPIDLGDQYVAQVGPFADEASARQALADIQRAYPGALLYRPRNQAASTASSSTASSGSEASSTPTESTSAAPTTAQAPAPSGPTYLQVGAFDRVESAQRLVGMLRDQGFAPTVNSPPDRKTTVLVGPYSGDALLRAEQRLDDAGLDHFRVR